MPRRSGAWTACILWVHAAIIRRGWTHSRPDLAGGRISDAAELLADPAIAAVVIATPHHTHEEIAIAAARAGKAILLEKPMAPSLAGCDAIAKAAHIAGVPLMVGHTQRFSASMLEAKALLEKRELGSVRFGSSAMVKLWMEPNRRPWHLTTSTGGGMLMTAGIHALDRLLWLVDVPVRSVFAMGGATFHDQEADDSTVMLLALRRRRRRDGGQHRVLRRRSFRRDGAGLRQRRAPDRPCRAGQGGAAGCMDGNSGPGFGRSNGRGACERMACISPVRRRGRA